MDLILKRIVDAGETPTLEASDLESKNLADEAAEIDELRRLCFETKAACGQPGTGAQQDDATTGGVRSR